MNPNALITGLNQWGEAAWGFARPMLLQSSLVMVVLWLADAGLRKLVSARVRHTLLLLVLVKLVLPPGLGWPLSPFYWLGALDAPVVATTAPPAPVTVTYSDPVRVPTPKASELIPAHSPSLTVAGGTIFVWGLGVVVLGACLAHRSRLIYVMVARSRPAPEGLAGLSARCCEQLGLRRLVALRVTDEFGSPAVCGLWRPVILLPERLARQLTPAGARAVLLHELVHVRRGDLWLNYAQTILQILYWFHPLLWLANGSIRRVREQAVDETVMEALRDEAGSYPETLVAVAKEALLRPRLALGLVGILESRQALRQRLDRLIGPASLCFGRRGVAWQSLALLAGALLLPMARGEKAGSGVAADQPSTLAEPNRAISLTTRLFKVSESELRALALSATGVLAGEEERLTRVVSAGDFNRLMERARPSGPDVVLTGSRAGIDTGVLLLTDLSDVVAGSGKTATLTFRRAGNTGTATNLPGGEFSLKCELTPAWAGGRLNLSLKGQITEVGEPQNDPEVGPRPGPRQPGEVYAVNAVGYLNLTLGPVNASMEPGQTLLVLAPSGPGAKGEGRLLVATTAAAAPPKKDSEGAVNDPLPDAPPSSASAVVTRVFDTSGQDLAKSIEARWHQPGILAFKQERGESELLRFFFETAAPATGPLDSVQYDHAAGRLEVKATLSRLDAVERKLHGQLLLLTRSFALGTNDLVQLIRSRWQRFGPPGLLAQGGTELLRAYFSSVNPRAGQLDAIFLDRAKGQLLARGTGEQLDGVEKELSLRLLARAQILIEAHWAEIPANAKAASGAPGTAGLLDRKQAAFVMDAVKETPTGKLIALPKVVTADRSQAQIQFSPDEAPGLPDGLKLTLLAAVSPDRTTLGAEFSVATATGVTLVPGSAGQSRDAAKAGADSPAAVPLRSLLFDGQTLMVPLGFRKAGTGEGDGTRHSFLLINLWLIDPAGNRVHTDDQLALLKSAAPAQFDW